MNNLNLNPNDLNDKIKVYERQVKGWFLENARNLLDKEHNNFISFMIAISYIEGVEQYKNGISSHSQSSIFFIKSFKKIFGGHYSDSDIRKFYKDARCSLFHVGMTSKSIILIKGRGISIEFINNDIIVDPKLFLSRIEEDFENYILKLKNPSNTELRENFNSSFSVI